MSDNSITDEGMSHFMLSKISHNLETLILFGNFQVSAASLKIIATSKECKSLKKLDLRSTFVSDVGIKVIHYIGNLLIIKVDWKQH